MSLDKILFTASSWLSQILAGPEKFHILSSTPAVLTTQPSSAILPKSTASPPSLLNAFSADRITPFSRSVSRALYLLAWLKACVVRTPPGAAEKSS